MDALIDRFARLAFPTLGALAMGALGCVDEGNGTTQGGGGGGGGATSTPGGGAGGTLSSNCFSNDIGTCCTSQVCLTHAEVDALYVPAGGAAAGGEGPTGGGGASPLACPAGNELPNDLCYWYEGNPPPGEMCCYDYGEGDCCGRPFLVDGRARVAVLAERDDWCGPTAPSELHAEIAAEWLADARLEHASIAAFARFTLQLLELGAPPELIAASQRAGLDELEHAKLCFALSSRLGGVPIGPAGLDLRAAFAPATLADVAALVVREGCVGETVAAALATTQLALAEDPEAVAALTRIAADEAEHAELAWRFIAWAIGRGGAAVGSAVESALAAELAALESRPLEPEDALGAATLHRFGRLTRAERRAARTRALREIVTPCAKRLLAFVPKEQGGVEAHS